jgi:hypothetical protein
MAGVVIAGILAACAGAPSFGRSYVGGYPVGDRICPSADLVCQPMIDIATNALGATEPEHRAITTAEAFRTDWRTKDGGRVLRNCSAPCTEGIVVLRLDDRAVRAFVVGCGTGLYIGTPTPETWHCSLSQPMEGEQ